MPGDRFFRGGFAPFPSEMSDNGGGFVIGVREAIGGNKCLGQAFRPIASESCGGCAIGESDREDRRVNRRDCKSVFVLGIAIASRYPSGSLPSLSQVRCTRSDIKELNERAQIRVKGETA